MAKFISVANMKGGVGKSTTAMMLADGLALVGRRVLLVDLDPQASLSFMLLGGRELRAVDEGMTNIGDVIFPIEFETTLPLAQAIKLAASKLEEFRSSSGRVDLVASSPRMRFEEMLFEVRNNRGEEDLLAAGKEAANRVAAKLDNLEQSYDYVVFDCPPSIGALSQAAIIKSNLVIIPTLADEVSVFAVGAFYDRGLSDYFGCGEDVIRRIVVTIYRSFGGGSEPSQQFNYLAENYGSEFYPDAVNYRSAISKQNPPPNWRHMRGLRAKYGDLNGFVRNFGRRIDDLLMQS